MTEHAGDLTGIALVIAVAVGLGMILTRMRQPALVGYIIAGVLLGPSGFGFVSHSASITLLAELGVLMLLFIVGMELSLKAFVLVLRPAVITASGQILAALGVTFLFGWVLGWSLQQSLLLGFLVAISSTAVAIKMLEDIGELRSQIGRITVGVMIAQDLAIIPMLIFLDALGGEQISTLYVGLKIVMAVVVLGLLIAFLNRRKKVSIAPLELIRGNVDLMALGVMAFCFGAAAISGLIGLSPAYGAFLAGLVIANSTVRTEAIRVTEPIQSVLIVVFFLSIGLLLDLSFIWDNLFTVLIFTLGIVVLKSLLNVALLHWVGYSWNHAFQSGLIMAQVGEFSFVLAAVGLKNGAIDTDGYRLAIAVIALSLLISPLWTTSVRRFHEVAQEEMVGFREALAEVYGDELEDIERGTNAVMRMSRATWHRAAVLARYMKRRYHRRRRDL